MTGTGELFMDMRAQDEAESEQMNGTDLELQRFTLNNDKHSTAGKRGTIYGRAGEVVTEIARHGNVLIVEGRSGRFPVKDTDIK